MAQTVKEYMDEARERMIKSGKEINFFDLNNEESNQKRTKNTKGARKMNDAVQFNIFKALFSGDRIFKEEFASSLLGYLLSPFEGHGLKTKMLITLLVGVQKSGVGISDDLLEHLNYNNEYIELFMDSPFDGNFGISLEYKFADIVIFIKTSKQEYVLVFENKIYDASEIDIAKQLNDYKRVLQSEKPNAQYLLFAIHPPMWNNQYKPDAGIIHVSWAKSEKTLCLVDIMKENLDYASEQAKGVLQQFIYFVEENNPPFSGFRLAPESLPRSIDLFLAHYSSDSDAAIRDFIREFISFSQKNNGFSEEQCDWDGPIMMLCDKANAKHACWPFKITNDGKLKIQWQGLLQEPFSYKKNAPDNIVKQIKARLTDGFARKDDNSHAVSLRDIANNNASRTRFWEVVEWLQQCLESGTIIK